MSRDGVSVADTFSIQKDSIKQVSINFRANIQSFTAMEEKWDVKVLLFALLPEIEKFRDKMTKLVTHFFVANKIEA